MGARTLFPAVALLVALHGRAQQQHDCLSCLEPPCSAAVCAAAGNASYYASRLSAPHDPSAPQIPLYIGGLFATLPGDVDGGVENYHHFMLAISMLNDKTDGW